MTVISVDAEDFRNFQRTLKKVNATISKELNKELRRVLNSTIIPAARSNASWSSRIPAAIRPTVGASKIGARVAANRAPHGRAYEGLAKGLRSNSSFRHPVFGNRNVWVEQRTRPFLAPAFDSHAGEASKAAEAAIQNAARSAGFK